MCHYFLKDLEKISKKQDKFNILRSSNNENEIEIFFTKDEKVYGTFCIKIEKIKLFETKICTKDLFIGYFYNDEWIDAFLQSNGIIRERSTSIDCDNTVHLFTSIDKTINIKTRGFKSELVISGPSTTRNYFLI